MSKEAKKIIEQPVNLAENTSQKESELVSKQIVSTVLEGFALVQPREDLSNETQEAIAKDLARLGIDQQQLLTMPAVEKYDSRFDFSLYGVVLSAHRALPILRFPDSNIYEFNKAYVDYLITHPEMLKKSRQKWQETAEQTGVLTPFSPLPTKGGIAEQVQNHLYNDTEVDVYSERNRYPLLFERLNQELPSRGFSSGTIIEAGTAACDNLYLLRNHASRTVGIDIHSLENIIDHPMMNEFRWKDNVPAKAEHLAKIRNSGITFIQGSMFDKELIRNILQGTPKPLLAMYLNVLYHFNSKKLTEALDTIMEHKPELLVIGGAMPGLGQIKDGQVLPGRHSRIFEIKDDESMLIAHTVDTNVFKD